MCNLICHSRSKEFRVQRRHSFLTLFLKPLWLVRLVSLIKIICLILAFRFYTIVAPQTLRPHSEYHVNLNTFALSEPMQVRVTINGSDDGGVKFLKSQEVFMDSNSYKTLEFNVGGVLFNFFFVVTFPTPRVSSFRLVT